MKQGLHPCLFQILHVEFVFPQLIHKARCICPHAFCVCGFFAILFSTLYWVLLLLLLLFLLFIISIFFYMDHWSDTNKWLIDWKLAIKLCPLCVEFVFPQSTTYQWSIIFAKNFFAERIVNVWNGLTPPVSFASLSTFRRSIQKVYFSQFMKCTWLFNFTIFFLTFTPFSFSG